MKWQVATVFKNGDIDLDRICGTREEAEKRAIQVYNYFSMFGGTTMILPCEMAKTMKKASYRA